MSRNYRLCNDLRSIILKKNKLENETETKKKSRNLVEEPDPPFPVDDDGIDDDDDIHGDGIDDDHNNSKMTGFSISIGCGYFNLLPKTRNQSNAAYQV